MQPKAVAACLVAGDHGCIVGKPTKAMLGSKDLVERPIQVASRNGSQARWLSVANSEGELPLAPTELESQVQADGGCGSVWFADRSHDELHVRQ